MQLQLDKLGRITEDYPSTFYRVSKWSNGLRVADFDNQAEAQSFAITDAKDCAFDHKVSTCHIN